MKKLRKVLLAPLVLSTATLAHNDAPQVLESKYPFAETVAALESALQEKGMTIFARIDHRQAAQANGLEMQPATVLIYGSPRAGTPLKVLITEPVPGRVEVLFNSAKQVVARSNTPYDAVENSLANVEKLIRATVAP